MATMIRLKCQASGLENRFFNKFNGTKPKLNGHYIDDCIGATSSSEKELEHFITSVNSFHPALKYHDLGNLWNFNRFSWYQSFDQWERRLPVCSTSLRIPTVICYIHPLILPTSKTPSRQFSQFLRLRRLCSHNSYFSNKSEKICAISSRSVAILSLLPYIFLIKREWMICRRVVELWVVSSECGLRLCVLQLRL